MYGYYSWHTEAMFFFTGFGSLVHELQIIMRQKTDIGFSPNDSLLLNFPIQSGDDGFFNL